MVLEQALETSANLYRQLQVERKQLMNTWRETVANLNSRDKHFRDTVVVSDFQFIQNETKSHTFTHSFSFFFIQLLIFIICSILIEHFTN